MKYALKVTYALVLALVLLFIPKMGAWVADLFNYTTIDPDGAFMWISVHHIAQALIILVIIVGMKKVTSIKFYLGVGDRSEGRKYLKRFILFFSIYTIVAFAFTLLSNSLQPFDYPLTARNISGYLSFQALLSGPSEELVFRAFSISAFAYLVSDKRLFKNISYAVIFASLIFGLAHVRFSFNPFTISYSMFQVGYAMVLGYFYGECYERTKGVIYPMIMHSFTNVLMVGLTILFSFFV